MNDTENRLLPIHLKDWTDWLSAHYKTDTMIWLRIRKTSSAKPGIVLAQAVTEALRFGWIDGRVNTIDEDYFWLRFTPRSPKSVWSMINRKRVEAMIEAKTLTDLGHQTVQWGKDHGTWDAAYTSLEKTEIPPELKAGLENDEIAQATFDAWTNSEKLQVLFWIASAKRPETRQLRIQGLLRHLGNQGKLKGLLESLKQ